MDRFSKLMGQGKAWYSPTMKTTKGKVLPNMNSQMPAMFIAIPPKKYQEPDTPVMEVLLAPFHSRKQNMVLVNGTRKPRTPSRVGLPGFHCQFGKGF